LYNKLTKEEANEKEKSAWGSNDERLVLCRD
jgi:hypothetical protein